MTICKVANIYINKKDRIIKKIVTYQEATCEISGLSMG